MSASVRTFKRHYANQFNGMGLSVAGVRKFLADVDEAGISDYAVVIALTNTDQVLTSLKAEEETSVL